MSLMRDRSTMDRFTLDSEVNVGSGRRRVEDTVPHIIVKEGEPSFRRPHVSFRPTMGHIVDPTN